MEVDTIEGDYAGILEQLPFYYSIGMLHTNTYHFHSVSTEYLHYLCDIFRMFYN
jgi:hypothetical protein